jgi:hypothetical protein
LLVEKQDKSRGSYRACINPECGYLHAPEGAPAPEAPLEAGSAAGHHQDAEDQSA